MKMKNLGIGLLLCCLMGSVAVSAQTKPKKTTRTKTQRPPTQSSGYGTQPASGNQPATTPQSSGYGNNNQPQQTNQPQANVPIVVIPSTGSVAMDSIKPSLRNDASIERNLVKDLQPLAY